MKTNKEKITKEFCEQKLSQGEVLLFFPKSAGEAYAIHTYLTSMGYRWPIQVDNDKILEDLCSQAAAMGMLLMKDKKLFTRPGMQRLKEGLLCELSQFAEDYSPPITLDDFNKLVAKVEAVEEVVKPKTLDKNKLHSPKTGL